MTDTNPSAAPPDYEFQGRSVAAGRGWDWIVEAFALFRKQPGLWILMALVLGVAFIVIGMVPLLGSLANALLLPIFGGGLMLGCKALDRGGALEFEDLFAGFKQKTGDLVLVGTFNLIGWVLIAFAVIAVIGGGVFMGLMSGGVDGASVSIASMLIALLLGAGLSVPLAMATWFAPALIVLQDLSAGAALKASFFACLRNLLAFLIYGVVMLALCIVAAIPLLLGYLVLIPVLIASVYTAYRDIFCAGQEP
jgi:hypothetical protein